VRTRRARVRGGSLTVGREEGHRSRTAAHFPPKKKRLTVHGAPSYRLAQQKMRANGGECAASNKRANDRIPSRSPFSISLRPPLPQQRWRQARDLRLALRRRRCASMRREQCCSARAEARSDCSAARHLPRRFNRNRWQALRARCSLGLPMGGGMSRGWCARSLHALPPIRGWCLPSSVMVSGAARSMTHGASADTARCDAGVYSCCGEIRI
jgi:hypothetical protein